MSENFDLIIEGNILTLSDARPRVEAAGVKNGRIAVIGDYADIRERVGENTRFLDLKKRTIVPGFIETHMHPTQVGNMLLNVDLAAATSIDEILNKLEDKKNNTPAGDSILGLGFNYDIVDERRLPKRQELDKLSSSHPIMVLVYDVHSAMVNTAMLEKLEIPEDTAGYIKDAGGRPTGSNGRFT